MLFLAASLTPLVGPASARTSHANFELQGDAALAARAATERWPGSGTPGNPYVIEGYDFVPSTGLPGSISLRQTTLHVLIRDNRFHDGSASGILLAGVKNVTVEGNTFERLSHVAITVGYSTDVTIRGNSILAMRSSGVSISSGVRARVEGNHMDGVVSGISVFAAATVADNTIRNPTAYGIFIVGDGTLVSGNRISGAGHEGIWVTGGGVRILDNEVTSSATYGIGIHGGGPAGPNVVAGNGVSGAKVGIRVFDAPNRGATIAGNAVDLADSGIHVEQVNGVKVLGNRVSARAVGLQLTSGRDHVVYGNSVSDAGTGLSLLATHLTTLSSNRLEGNAVGLLLNVSEGNLVFDNAFANPRNVALVASDDNRWNVEKTPGRNVLGGAFLGGNFWSDYTGVDADGDGLGEIPHGPIPRWAPHAPPSPVILPEAVAPLAPRAPGSPAPLPQPGALLAPHFAYGPHDRAPLMKDRVALVPPDPAEVIPGV